MNPDNSLHHQLPPDGLFWAILDPREAGLSRRPALRQLGYLFERHLPVSVEQVRATYAGLPDGRWIACGILKDNLVKRLPDNAVTCTPESLPAWIDADVELARLNLLTREFEPAAVRRLRQWCTVAVLGILLLLTALLTTGLEHKRATILQDLVHIEQSRQELLNEILGAPQADSTQPQELRLIAELRRLRLTRQPDMARLEQVDVTDELARLLAVWPDDTKLVQPLHVRTELLSITPGSMTLRCLLDSAGDAERLAGVLRAIPHWELGQPQITATRDAVQASLRFAPESISAKEDPS